MQNIFILRNKNKGKDPRGKEGLDDIKIGIKRGNSYRKN